MAALIKQQARPQVAGRRESASSARRLIQRDADSGQQAAINARADGVAAQARENTGDANDDNQARGQIDQAEKEKREQEQLASFAQPDKVSAPASEVQSATSQVHAEVAAATQPLVEKRAEPRAPSPTATANAEAAVSAANAEVGAAVALAEAVPDPDPLKPVEPPRMVAPVDAGGARLPIDPAGDAVVGAVAVQIAQLRSGGHLLAADGAAHQARSHALTAALVAARGQIDEASGSIDTVKGHVEHRRSVVEHARTAQQTSEEKADRVVSEAPGVAANADAGRQKSSPMAGEAGNLASQSAAAKPDDADGAAKAEEQGGQLTRVSASLGEIDSAVGETGDRARTLEADAQQAKADNAASAADIADATGKLDATDAKLGELASQNEAARAQVAGMADRPAELADGAATLQADAADVIANSHSYETRLREIQDAYAAQLQGIPPARGAGGSGGASTGSLIQRQPAPNGDGSSDLNALAQAISGESQTDDERASAAARAREQQLAELAQINQEAGGDFSRLDAGQKAGLALQLTFTRTFSGLSETNWPKFGATLLRGFVDPRVSLAGVLTGLGMILTGGANLLSARAWEQDPLGNLLKSTAEIANGVTIVLGSIAGLAVAIIAISAALILVSFGALSPVLLPVIGFCGTVAATVGPWAITAAEVALVLNGLVFIKDLIDAATAPTAQELQRDSQAMGQDVNAMASSAMQIGGAALGEAIAPSLGPAMEGVEARLANSGSTIAANVADNLGDIRAAMSHAPAGAEPGGPEAESPTPPDTTATPPDTTATPPDTTATTPAPSDATPAGPDAATAQEPTPSAGPDSPPSTEPSDLGVNHDGKPVVAEANVAEGDATVKVTEEGECEICSSPCGSAEDKFPEAMQDPGTAAKVNAAESAPDPQAKAAALAEVVPELESAEAAATLKSELEARIEAIEDTGAPVGDLVQELDDINIESESAHERLSELEERIDRAEHAGRDPAEDSQFEAGAQEEAIRKGALTERGEQMEANAIQGKAGELGIEEAIVKGETLPELGSPAELRGSQVRVEIGDSVRIIDHLVELPGPPPELVALEVKTGGSPYTKLQEAFDAQMATAGADVVSSSVPYSKLTIRTVVIRR